MELAILVALRVAGGLPRSEVPLRPSARLPMLAAVAVLVAACTGGSASPQPSEAASANSSTAWLRATPFRAGRPLSQFASGPTAVITADGAYVTAEPVDAKNHGPLLPGFVGRSLSEAGRATIQAEAERLGLLGKKTDLRSVIAMPGGVLGRLELTGGGGPVTLVGEPDAKLMCLPQFCDPLPGTPEAFGELWRKIVDPVPWLGGELGPEIPFVPAAYALLLEPAPAQDPGAGASIADWPLAVPLATFGSPVAKGPQRCGIVSGADAEALRPALEDANLQTQWVQDPGMSATFGLTVRPIIADEDPCVEVLGG